MRTWIELPEALIEMIDAVGTAASPFEFQFSGVRRTRSLKLQSLLYQAQSNPPIDDAETPEPQTPTLTPIRPIADSEALDWQNLGTHALTRSAIDKMETADLWNTLSAKSVSVTKQI